MIKEKLSVENQEKLLEAFQNLYDFCVTQDMNPMVMMHLQQITLHLDRDIKQQNQPNDIFIPVTICLTPEQFDRFIYSVLINKTPPTNDFLTR